MSCSCNPWYTHSLGRCTMRIIRRETARSARPIALTLNEAGGFWGKGGREWGILEGPFQYFASTTIDTMKVISVVRRVRGLPLHFFLC